MNRREALAGLAAAALAPPFPARGRQAEVLPWSDLEPLPAGTRARYTDLSRVRDEVVPNPEFFVLHHGEVPRIQPDRFRLSVGARNAPARTLDLAELAGLPRVEAVALFECCGNGGIGMHGLVGAARWGGVPLAPLLEEHIGPESREVVFFGADRADERLRGRRYPGRFARSLPVADALAPGALLADAMNGEPLQRIEVWPERFAGWHQAKDYVTVRGVETPAGVLHTASAVGRMRLKSLATRVERIRDAALRIHGLAWNDGAAPIRRVDIRVDDAPFRDAELLPAAHRFGFRRFRMDGPAPPPGAHRIVSRAHDDRGSQPTEEEASRYKATPWENNGQVARRIRLP